MRAAAPVVEALREISEDRGCTPAQIALAWVTQRRPGAVVAIPGASTPTQAEHNARSMEVRLSPDEVKRLDKVSDPARS